MPVIHVQEGVDSDFARDEVDPIDVSADLISVYVFFENDFVVFIEVAG